MKRSDSVLLQDAVKGLLAFLLALLVCRFLSWVGTLLVVLIVLGCALAGRSGLATAGFALLPIFSILNYQFLSKEGLTGVVLRIGTLAVAMAMFFVGSRSRGRNKIPLGGLWGYLFVALISSFGGYCPLVSYLKVLNFAILLFGISYGFRNIDRSAEDLRQLHMFFRAVCVFIILGSFCTLAFPGVAYATSVRGIMAAEGEAAAAAAAKELTGLRLFSGVAYHSQCLAVVLPACLAWLLLDMICIERRVSFFHCMLFAVGLPLVYMTRSRVAFLMTAAEVGVIYFYCMKKLALPMRIKERLRSAATVAVVVLFAACVVLEIKNQSISRWLRKTEDVRGDDRGLSEAFTSSRQGKIDENMSDFYRNPLFGSGFQVSYQMQYMYGKKGSLILSAPVEKGVLPLMVLGETGLTGMIVFVIFVFSFYSTCIRRRYFCLLTMMTAMFVSNLGEATFFSPGGTGGAMWIICVSGGFVIDMMALRIDDRRKAPWPVYGGGMM